MGGLLLWFLEKRCFNFAGGSPAATYFLLNGQEKVSKEKAALVSRPFGLPCVTQRAGRLTRDSNSVLISACDSRRQ